MGNPAASPNRNVVSRRVAIKPRVEARTTEIDCSQFAKLIDEKAPTPAPDLDAEIEVVATLTATSTPSTPRFAHTLPREAPPASPAATMPMPATAIEALTTPTHDVALAPTAPEPMFAPASAYDLEEPYEIPRSRAWIVFAGVSVAMAVIALIAVLRI